MKTAFNSGFDGWSIGFLCPMIFKHVVWSSKSAPEYQPPTQKNLAAFAFSGTIRDSMDKRRGQADSDRSKQVGITFTEVLIVVESGGSGGGLWGRGDQILAIIRKSAPTFLVPQQPELYGQMELTGGFSGRNQSRIHSPRKSDCS